MTRDVTGAPGIPILEPSAAHIVVLLVDLQLDVLQQPLSLVRHLQAAGAGADAHHANLTLGVQGLFGDSVRVEVLIVPFILVDGVGVGQGIGVWTRRYSYDPAGRHCGNEMRSVAPEVGGYVFLKLYFK